MSRVKFFKEIISGQRRGLLSSLARLVLWIGSFPYSWAVAWRNRKFDRADQVFQADAPVISIGNLTTGGTGKTPLVCYLCENLRKRNLRVTILSRGYGADEKGVNDEAKELELRLPDVPHLQDPDRKKIADIATDELESEILVLDDGFQHRRLHRDFDLVVIDATEPFGYGYLLPRGLLREQIRNLDRADFVVINRCNQVAPEALSEIRRRIHQSSPEIQIAETATVALESIDFRGHTESLDQFVRKKALAFCGIGNPKGFENTLRQLKIDWIEPLKTFPDHHQYSRDDIELLRQWVTATSDCDFVLCTHKDLVKINLAQIGGKPLRAILIANQFVSGEESLWQALGESLRMGEIVEST